MNLKMISQYQRRVKECVDDGDDDDTKSGGMNLDELVRPLGMNGDVLHAKADMWLGGRNGGVFFDYSRLNYSNSPNLIVK
jgi:hypothetical protein